MTKIATATIVLQHAYNTHTNQSFFTSNKNQHLITFLLNSTSVTLLH